MTTLHVPQISISPVDSDIHSLDDLFRKSRRLQKVLSDTEQQLIRGIIDARRDAAISRAELEREKMMLSSEVQEKDSRMEQLQDELNEKIQLRAEMAGRTEKLLDIKEKQRKRDVTKLEKTIKELHQDIYEKAQTIDQREKELVDFKEQIRGLLEENDKLRESVAIHERVFVEKNELQEEIIRVKRDLEEKDNLLNKFVYPVQENQSDSKESNLLKRVLTPRPKQLEMEVNQLKIRLAQKERELDDMADDLQQREVEMERLQELNKNLEENVKAMNAKYEAKAVELAQLNERQSKRMNKLNGEVKELMIEASKNGVSESQREIKALECSVLLLSNQYNNLQHELQRISRKIREISDQDVELSSVPVAKRFSVLINSLKEENIKEKDKLQNTASVLNGDLKGCSAKLQLVKWKLEAKMRGLPDIEEQKFPRSILKYTPSTPQKNYTGSGVSPQPSKDKTEASSSTPSTKPTSADSRKQVRLHCPPLDQNGSPAKKEIDYARSSFKLESHSAKGHSRMQRTPHCPAQVSHGAKHSVTGLKLFNLPPAKSTPEDREDSGHLTRRAKCDSGRSSTNLRTMPSRYHMSR
ncbi:interaptin isoform X2 [Lingula anatina]|nr:interaptin isoform X2 [Lingula anatina]|eukprot:XP_013408168.1 interaptin isoform X2 [Lingula anatina]